MKIRNASLHLPAAVALAAMLALSSAPGGAHATTRIFAFAGAVVDDPEDSGYQSFTGTLQFDTTVADVLPGDPSTGIYPMPDGLGHGFQVLFDGVDAYAFTHSATLSVLNDYAGRDWLLPLGYGNAAQTRSVSLELIDFSAGAFDSDALPLVAPPLAAFAVANLRFELPSFGLTGQLEQLSCIAGCDISAPPIPEPGTWALALAGLGAVGSVVRRRRPLR